MSNIGRVRVVFTGIPAGPGIATHFYHLDEAWNWAGYADNLRDGVFAAYDELVSLIPDDVTFTVKADVDVINDANGELVATYTGSDQTQAFESLSGFGPLGVGFCCTWRTAGIVNSKHVRGRTFIVPVDSETIHITGTPTDLSLTHVNDWASAMETALGAFGDMVVWSRPKYEEDGTTLIRAGSSHEVTNHTIADKFAVLRSRRD